VDFSSYFHVASLIVAIGAAYFLRRKWLQVHFLLRGLSGPAEMLFVGKPSETLRSFCGNFQIEFQEFLDPNEDYLKLKLRRLFAFHALFGIKRIMLESSAGSKIKRQLTIVHGPPIVALPDIDWTKVLENDFYGKMGVTLIESPGR
jgi:hypothetical protein